MKLITDSFNSTLETKKSKFITYIFPYSNFKVMMDILKKKYYKGRHFVYAYRYLNEFNQIIEYSSDDGEPKGTSGKPTLNVLIGNQLINTAVIIIRYFGGIKLGTGGLVKAYSSAVNLVLEKAILETYINLEKRKLNITYSQLSKVEYQISKYNIKIIEKEFNYNVSLIIESDKEEFLKLSNILDINIVLEDY